MVSQQFPNTASSHFTEEPLALVAEESCAGCQKPSKTDLVIRCHLCRAVHHLDCYSKKGCAVFGCLNIKAIHISNQSEESLAENVFRAELKQSVNRWSSKDDSFLAFVTICIIGAFFFFLYLLF
ncbi:MAG: hypothetical protein P1V97_26860 [Planctomycetota bacterium]|nr:hypothetical protein [Planctomycetota bacterium]